MNNRNPCLTAEAAFTPPVAGRVPGRPSRISPRNYRETVYSTAMAAVCSWFISTLLGVCMLLAAGTAAVAALPESEQSIRDIQRKQQEIEQKLREKEKREREAEEKGKELEIAPPREGGMRFMIREIVLQNPVLLGKTERKELLSPFLNREINYNDITALVGRITNTLVKKGYVTARVKVPLGQNLKSGRLVLTVITGRIEDIVPEKESVRRRMQIFSAFPFFKGRPLNIDDMDYGIEKMNRLESNDATMKILPGEDLGASKIMVYNSPGWLLHLETGVDNLGQESTGEYRKKISAGFDNLISINDYGLFSYTDGADPDTGDKYTRCYTAFFEFPLGYWTFSSTYSRSEYMRHVSGLSTRYKINGSDTSGVFSLGRLIWRRKYNRLQAKISLTLKEKETFIQNVKIDVQSDRLSITGAGLEYNGFLLGGYFYAAAGYDRGWRFLGANKDAAGMSEDMPRAQFDKYKFNLFWNRPFPVLTQAFGYSITAGGQYGMQTLYGSEQFSIGDFYTVRGFKNASAVGDRGYYVRNELSIYDFSRFWSRLKGLKFFTGFDYGYIIDKTGKSANGGQGEASLAGISAGVGYSCRLFNLNVTYGRRIKSPKFIKEDSSVVYCTLTMNLNGIFNSMWDLVSKKGD